MYNLQLTEHQAAAIDKQVAKVLRGLGNPKPPLSLDDVRELQKLDRKFYSSSDTSYLRETVSRLIVGGKQVLRRPMLAWEAVKKRDLKALWVPDRKRILIDSTLPELKWRWSEAHEIGHSLIEWHEYMLHGDDKHTLTPLAEQQIEAEANFAAGRLLFLRGEFEERLISEPVTNRRVLALAKEFQNTIATTLWRTVESMDIAAFGLVSQHPAQRQDPDKPTIRYFIRSRQFAECFPAGSQQRLFAKLQGVCRAGRGPIGDTEIVLADANGDDHVFHMEAFFTKYDSLTLGLHTHKKALAVGGFASFDH